MNLYTVAGINQYIKELFDSSDVLQDVLVEGEISNFSQASSGHCYFTLKDSSAEIRCVMWKTLAVHLHVLPDQGDLVQVRGYVSVYERSGAYQLYVNRLSSVGAGDLWQRYLELKDRLDQEGLFAAEHKLAIPEWPHRVGLVTSPTGAALQDMLNVIGIRYPLVDLVLAPTLVQGVQAPESIVHAIHQLEQESGIDVIILARGGGSLEDLWAFNDEGVARAIYDCPLPMITGVGHETDFTLADFAADFRTPTPTAAAAAAVPDRLELVDRLNGMALGLDQAVQRAVEQRWELVDRAEMRLERHTPVQRLQGYRQRLAESRVRLIGAVQRRLERRMLALDGASDRIDTLDPRRVLRRGYALISDSVTGRLLTRQAMISQGQALHIEFADGNIEARATSTGTGREYEEDRHDVDPQ